MGKICLKTKICHEISLLFHTTVICYDYLEICLILTQPDTCHKSKLNMATAYICGVCVCDFAQLLISCIRFCEIITFLVFYLKLKPLRRPQENREKTCWVFSNFKIIVKVVKYIFLRYRQHRDVYINTIST